MPKTTSTIHMPSMKLFQQISWEEEERAKS
jgi:hypothetical protein